MTDLETGRGAAVSVGTFTVTYIGDAPGHDPKRSERNPQRWQEFREAVRPGDILTFNVRFDDEPLNRQVCELRRKAKR